MEQPTLRSPDGATITGPDGLQYRLRSQSADKHVYQGITNPGDGIAVASTSEKNQRLIDELKYLEQINEQMGMLIFDDFDIPDDVQPPVLPTHGSIFYLTKPDTLEQQCAAFRMKWISGFDSRTDKAEFERALARQRGNSVTVVDLKLISHFIGEKASIKDLQVILEPSTGHLMILDPRGLDEPISEQVWIKKWTGILNGTVDPSTADSYRKKD